MHTGFMLLMLVVINIAPWIITLFVGSGEGWQKELQHLMTTKEDIGYIFDMSIVVAICSLLSALASFFLKSTKNTRLAILVLCVVQPLVIAFFFVLPWDVWLLYGATIYVAFHEYRPFRKVGSETD